MVSAKLARKPAWEKMANRDVLLKWHAWCGGERSRIAVAVSEQGDPFLAVGVPMFVLLSSGKQLGCGEVRCIHWILKVHLAL